MAEKKTTSAKSSTTKTNTKPKTNTTSKTTTQSKPATKSTSSSTSSSKKTRRRTRSVWGLNKISFYLMGAVAILYLIGLVLSACGISLAVVSALQGLATALMICVIAYLGYKYVKPKQTVWLVLYITFLLVILVGIIVPLVV